MTDHADDIGVLNQSVGDRGRLTGIVVIVGNQHLHGGASLDCLILGLGHPPQQLAGGVGAVANGHNSGNAHSGGRAELGIVEIDQRFGVIANSLAGRLEACGGRSIVTRGVGDSSSLHIGIRGIGKEDAIAPAQSIGDISGLAWGGRWCSGGRCRVAISGRIGEGGRYHSRRLRRILTHKGVVARETQRC